MNSNYENDLENGFDSTENEGATGELRGENINSADYTVNQDEQQYNASEEAQYYGYNQPYFNGRPLPQYMYQNNASENGQTDRTEKRSGQKAKKVKKSKLAGKNGKRDSFGRKAGRLAAGGLVFGLAAGAAFQGVNYGASLLQSDSNNQGKTEAVMAEESDVETQPLANLDGSATPTLVYDVSDIAAKVKPSIVSITTTVTERYQYFYQEYEQQQTGAGSGIIIGKTDDVLYIATNYHVIKDAEEINVGFVDGEIVKAAVKGYDEDADIAVCAVRFADMKESTAKAITIAAIGDSDKLAVGEPAIAIGNALGYGQSVTVGYISALDRTIQDSDGTYIQTDAAINPGNSGGALIDINGQVIGINSVKYVDSKVEGMGFSIPINEAMEIINDIISGNNGKTYIGITGADISKEYSQIYGFPEGIYVKEVASGSPAEEAGIHAGDIIVEFDGQSVYTMEELSSLVKEKDEGDKVRVVVYRTDSMGNYKQMKLEVTLAKGIVE